MSDFSGFVQAGPTNTNAAAQPPVQSLGMKIGHLIPPPFGACPSCGYCPTCGRSRSYQPPWPLFIGAPVYL